MKWKKRKKKPFTWFSRCQHPTPLIFGTFVWNWISINEFFLHAKDKFICSNVGVCGCLEILKAINTTVKAIPFSITASLAYETCSYEFPTTGDTFLRVWTSFTELLLLFTSKRPQMISPLTVTVKMSQFQKCLMNFSESNYMDSSNTVLHNSPLHNLHYPVSPRLWYSKAK